MHGAKLICGGKLIYGRAGGGGDLGAGNSIGMDEALVDWSPCASKTSIPPRARTQLVRFRIKGNLPLTFRNMPSVPFNKCTSSVRVRPRSGQLAI